VSGLLSLLPADDSSRVGRDRLELLTALIRAPSFDSLYRADVIEVPPHHLVYGWACQVSGCECAAHTPGLCIGHEVLWRKAGRAQITRAEFVRTAAPIRANSGIDPGQCRICPDRPAENRTDQLCRRHRSRWHHILAATPAADFSQWLTAQAPLPGYGTCQVTTCPHLAASPTGLCPAHDQKYWRAGRPGNVRLPGRWGLDLEDKGRPVHVLADDELAFRRWCSAETPFYRHGVVNLMGLQPLVKAEIQWGMFAHAQSADPAHWDCSALQRLAILCRASNLTSLFDLAGDSPQTRRLPRHDDGRVQRIVRATIESLWCVYYSPADTRDAGFIETDHFGRRLNQSRSHFDLTGVSQRWLRDMLWDHLAAMLQSSRCPRSRGPFDNGRRAAIQLSAFLETEAPQGGHDPSLLKAEHAQRFVADLRYRARHSSPALGIHRPDGKPSTVTEGSRRHVFNHIRAITYQALETGASDRIGLHRDFITALPAGGPDLKRSRSPFSDDVARALSDEENLRQLAAVYDRADRGLRDVWETIVYTGRRCSEVLALRLDCIGRYRGLPMLWHDQTKVGNYNDAIRIPEYLYQRLDARRATTLGRFEDRHGRPPTPAERAAMALFPTTVRYSQGERPISYSLFQGKFKEWVESLDLGSAVTHQARHTLATNLLRAGASLAQIRRYLGQLSDRMAEHYTKVTNTDLEDVLNAVWVAGPGSANPGKLLSGGLTPMKREEALALALDLSRRSTPTEGGFCTFQPVVNGGSCPWNLDCVNCDKFVLSGADLLYWRRKQEQWRAIAERAPDDATADYLHQVFEPTARAIDGLEKALAGLGLLDQALALDFRRPQDYFHNIWSTAFHPGDLANAVDSEPGAQSAPA
jgi:integrase